MTPTYSKAIIVGESGLKYSCSRYDNIPSSSKTVTVGTLRKIWACTAKQSNTKKITLLTDLFLNKKTTDVLLNCKPEYLYK